MKKLLLTRESPEIQPLRELIEKQKHRTLVLWVIECAGHVLPIFEDKFPEDNRPREAVEVARAWMRGEIKMPVAKKAAHAAHNTATAVAENPAAEAAARTMGHVVGTVHVETHAIGVVMYGVTAFVYNAMLNSEGLKGAVEQKNVADRKNFVDAAAIIERECKWFYDQLLYWEANIDKIEHPWASFLLRDDVPNKEKLLREKTEKR